MAHLSTGALGRSENRHKRVPVRDCDSAGSLAVEHLGPFASRGEYADNVKGPEYSNLYCACPMAAQRDLLEARAGRSRSATKGVNLLTGLHETRVGVAG